MISFGEGRAPIDELLEQRRLTRRIALYVPHFAVVPHVVLATDLIATVPERLARSFARLGGMRVVPTPFEVPGFEMNLMWRDHLHDDPTRQWLCGLLTGLFVAPAARRVSGRVRAMTLEEPAASASRPS